MEAGKGKSSCNFMRKSLSILYSKIRFFFVLNFLRYLGYETSSEIKLMFSLTI